jgi:DNA-binding FrmR family transcriptional regulator
VASSRGYTADKRQLLARLARVEGQVRGLRRMLEEDRPPLQLITQLLAVQGALDLVGLGLVDQHAAHCLLGEGDGPKEPRAQIDEILGAMACLLRRSPTPSPSLEEESA